MLATVDPRAVERAYEGGSRTTTFERVKAAAVELGFAPPVYSPDATTVSAARKEARRRGKGIAEAHRRIDLLEAELARLKAERAP